MERIFMLFNLWDKIIDINVFFKLINMRGGG